MIKFLISYTYKLDLLIDYLEDSMGYAPAKLKARSRRLNWWVALLVSILGEDKWC